MTIFYLTNKDSGITANGVVNFKLMEGKRQGIIVMSNTGTKGSCTQINVTVSNNSTELAWITPPLRNFDVGAWSCSIWGREAATGTNAGWKAQLQLWDEGDGLQSNISNMTANNTELTTSVAQRSINVAQVPVQVKNRERLILRIFANNVGTMATGWVRMFYGGATAGANGDCFLNVANTVEYINYTRSC